MNSQDQQQPAHSAQEAAERAVREIGKRIHENDTFRFYEKVSADLVTIILRHFQAVPAQSPGSGEALREAIRGAITNFFYSPEHKLNGYSLEQATDEITHAITPFLAHPPSVKIGDGKDGERLQALARLVWESRWAGEQEDYTQMVGIAAEILSGNFAGIDRAKADAGREEK